MRLAQCQLAAQLVTADQLTNRITHFSIQKIVSTPQLLVRSYATLSQLDLKSTPKEEKQALLIKLQNGYSWKKLGMSRLRV